MVKRERVLPPLKKGQKVHLHLNGRPVGTVVVKGWDTSWGFGQFEPREDFAAFAPLFGRWSLIMHEDEHSPLSADAARELREAEMAIDALHVQLHIPDQNAWAEVGQINIDGNLIEWKTV